MPTSNYYTRQMSKDEKRNQLNNAMQAVVNTLNGLSIDETTNIIALGSGPQINVYLQLSYSDERDLVVIDASGVRYVCTYEE